MKNIKIFKNLVVTLSLVTIIFPMVASAHVRWFATSEKVIPAYKLTDPFVLIAIMIALFIIFLGIFLEKKLKLPKVFDKYVERFAPSVLSFASMGFGLAFIIFSIKGFVFAPNLPAVGDMGHSMIALQALAGIMIFFGLYERIGGALLILLFILGIKEYGAFNMADTLEMVGFAFYAMIVGRPKWKIIDTELFQSFSHKIHEYGLPILRIGTGLNLMVLGFSEKILAPSLTANFLEHYHWNFMQTLGFHYFTDYYFAFSAGMVEILFGIFFLLGLVTRITTIFLAVFLVTTLSLLGPVELIGHLPHFSIAIVLLLFGSGSRFLLINKKS